MPRTVKPWEGKSDDTSIPARVKIRILERQEKRCACCGVRALRFEYDHVIAIINGGKNHEDNLEALCIPCHGNKTKADLGIKKKIARVQKKHHGVTGPKSPASQSRFKRKMDGSVVDRETGQPVPRRKSTWRPPPR